MSTASPSVKVAFLTLECDARLQSAMLYRKIDNLLKIRQNMTRYGGIIGTLMVYLHSPSEGKPCVVLAVFDFDGTLTKRDSLIPFLTFVVGYRRMLYAIARNGFGLASMLFGIVERQIAKEALLKSCLAGMSETWLNDKGLDYARDVLRGELRPEGLSRIDWHRSQGHVCVLLSASIHTYLDPLGKQIGMDKVIASRLRYSPERLFQGKLEGKNCRGDEKVRRLFEEFSRDDVTEIYAYGDSDGDKELLGVAQHSFYRSFGNEMIT